MVDGARRAERALEGRRAADARHRHRHQHRPDDRRQHRIGCDHELYGDRRRRESRLAARIAQQAIRHSDYHQRRDARAAELGRIGSVRSATSSSKARPQPVAIFEVVGRGAVIRERHTYEARTSSLAAAARGRRSGARAVRRPRQGLKKAQQAKEPRTRSTTSTSPKRRSARSARTSARRSAQRFGVVQKRADPQVRHARRHDAGAAVGTAEPAWTFIVLDTDGVNAFASPGGIVHITRGALGLITQRSGAGRRARA